MPVGNHCRRSFAKASPEDSIRDAARRMKDEKAGCLVVVDEKDRPLGTVTDRDVAMQVLRRSRDPDQTQIGELMHEEITTVWESTPLLTAFRRMRADGLRRIPVTDDNGRAVGLIEWDDALQVIANELSQAARVAQSQWNRAED